MSTVARRSVVGVLGSGTTSHRDRAEPLGRWLAELGVHLLTGGGGGVMASVSRAFVEARPRLGLSIGVLPAGARADAPPEGYPNPWIELPIATHLAARGDAGTEAPSRNHINVLSADVLVVLPGRPGTASEVVHAAMDGPSSAIA